MISPRACTVCGFFGHTKQWCKVKQVVTHADVAAASVVTLALRAETDRLQNTMLELTDNEVVVPVNHSDQFMYDLANTMIHIYRVKSRDTVTGDDTGTIDHYRKGDNLSHAVFQLR